MARMNDIEIRLNALEEQVDLLMKQLGGSADIKILTVVNAELEKIKTYRFGEAHIGIAGNVEVPILESEIEAVYEVLFVYLGITGVRIVYDNKYNTRAYAVFKIPGEWYE